MRISFTIGENVVNIYVAQGELGKRLAQAKSPLSVIVVLSDERTEYPTGEGLNEMVIQIKGTAGVAIIRLGIEGLDALKQIGKAYNAYTSKLSSRKLPRVTTSTLERFNLQLHELQQLAHSPVTQE